MKKSVNLLFNFCLLTQIQSTKIPQRFDDLSNLSNKLFLSILEQTISLKSKSYESLPPSISFFSADAKFDGENLKFCEIGNGLYGVHVPAYSIINKQKAILYPPYWEFLWLYATKFNIPIWCITYQKTNIAHKTLEALGGKCFDNIEEFEHYLQIKFPDEKTIKQKPQKIEDHIGILAYAGVRISCEKLEDFKKQHPRILFINDFPNLYQRRKDKIHEVFNDRFLSQFRPHWGVYPAEFSDDLVKRIKQDIKSENYIIKPLIGRQAHGVTLVSENNLNIILKKILQAKEKKPQKKDSLIKYWKNYEYDTFIVEEFVESKTIFKNENPYDPTLRLGFIISQNNGIIEINVISAFWKFPPKPLNARCNSAEKHITLPMVGAHEPAMATSTQDIKKIREILHDMLPKLYEKITEKRD